jgi:hypothetical protein
MLATYSIVDSSSGLLEPGSVASVCRSARRREDFRLECLGVQWLGYKAPPGFRYLRASKVAQLAVVDTRPNPITTDQAGSG